MRDRGKRRSRSQRIGKAGELLFAIWANENGLLPQKVGDDYGVDFFAQISTPISRGHEDITGRVLAAHVRSVEKAARKRIRLTREDVVNACAWKSHFASSRSTLNRSACIIASSTRC
jgi:hypothetical protein